MTVKGVGFWAGGALSAPEKLLSSPFPLRGFRDGRSRSCLRRRRGRIPWLLSGLCLGVLQFGEMWLVLDLYTEGEMRALSARMHGADGSGSGARPGGAGTGSFLPHVCRTGTWLRKLSQARQVWTRVPAIGCSPEARWPRREGAGGRWGASWPCWQVPWGGAICSCPLAPSPEPGAAQETGAGPQQGHCAAGWLCTLPVF